MTHARLLRFDLEAPVHAQVPCAALWPADADTAPVCLVLHGGGGSREVLADLQSSFEAAWANGQQVPRTMPEAGSGGAGGSGKLEAALGWRARAASVEAAALAALHRRASTRPETARVESAAAA